MGTSTFCTVGTDEAHLRCKNAGIACDCQCHSAGGDVRLSELREAQAPEPSTNGGRRVRRFFTDEQKKAIVAEWEEAPTGTKSLVAKRHDLADSVLRAWVKKFGDYVDPRTLPRDGASTIENREPSTEDPGTDDEVEIEVWPEAEPDEVTIELEPGDRDILEAVGFLDQLTVPELVAVVVSQYLEERGAESDVELLVTVRRAHRGEAA